MTAAQRREAVLVIASGGASIEALAAKYGIHPRTLARTLRAASPE